MPLQAVSCGDNSVTLWKESVAGEFSQQGGRPPHPLPLREGRSREMTVWSCCPGDFEKLSDITEADIKQADSAQ